MKRRGRPPHPDVLTPRQWEVLALIREGLTDREIAQRLGISVDGVKFHVSEILGKLGVTSRNEAARWFEERVAAPTACLAGRHARRSRRWRRAADLTPWPFAKANVPPSLKGRGNRHERATCHSRRARIAA